MRRTAEGRALRYAACAGSRRRSNSAGNEVPPKPGRVISPAMSSNMHRWIAFAALAVAAISPQLTPATARADLHNITYRARIDGVAPGSQATFLTTVRQTNTRPLCRMPGNAFGANTVLAYPNQAGMRVSVRWAYAANVH